VNSECNFYESGCGSSDAESVTLQPMADHPFITVIPPRSIDFDGFPVRRMLPHRGLRGVGPWVFFDHMGPFDFLPGRGIDVIPHPHINLATVTYLFDGRITHRDSLGNEQDISPGAVNLMVAGRGIAHSERTPPDLRAKGHRVHGLQLWHALPAAVEESDPGFLHYDAAEIPEISRDGVDLRILIGSLENLTSPVTAFLPTVYVEARIPADRRWVLPDGITERGIYGVEGRVRVNDRPLDAGEFAVLTPEALTVEADRDSRLVLIGGDSPGDRYIWWNFVSSRRDRIEKAQSDWKSGRFPKVAGDDGERAPLPAADHHARMLE